MFREIIFFLLLVGIYPQQILESTKKCVGVKNINITITNFKTQLGNLASKAKLKYSTMKEKNSCIKNAANKMNEGINSVEKKYKNNVDLFAAKLLESIQTNKGNLKVCCDSDIDQIKEAAGATFFETIHNITKELQNEKKKFDSAKKNCN